ncbi:MAG: VTT domain-containing protein [Elusimicrobia bacterium]|nr:VTT domain-containing protein [Elusimicrobiota bacterium]
MMTQATAWIMALIKTHGAAAVFIGVIIESVIVPIPSPLIIMGAGAILIEPGLGLGAALPGILGKIVLPGAVASTLGAFIGYGIAYWGGKPVIDRFSSFLGFTWDEILGMEKRLEGRVGPMLFFLRALPIVPLSLISAAAGVLRIPAAPFTIWTFLGSVPRCLVLGVLGYMTRDSYEGLAGNLNKAESFVSLGIVAGAFALILFLRARMRRA